MLWLWVLLLNGFKPDAEMPITWKASLCRGDVKATEVIAGLGGDWHVGAPFSFPVPVAAPALALPGAAESESTGHVEKNTCWPVQILPLSEALLLSHKLLRNGFGRQKAHFHLRIQCDDWYGWAKIPGGGAWRVLPTAELPQLAGLGMGLAHSESISLVWLSRRVCCGARKTEESAVLKVCI